MLKPAFQTPFPTEQKHELWEAATQKQNHKITPDPMLAFYKIFSDYFTKDYEYFAVQLLKLDKGVIYDVHSNSQLTGGVTNELVQQANKT